MRREDVEALLDEALDAIGSFGYVDAEHLAALCRRWLAVEGAEDGIADVLHKLDSWCEAYPESVFPEPTPEQIKQVNGAYAGAVTRISASMGRHMVKHMREMADAVRRIVPEAGLGGGGG